MAKAILLDLGRRDTRRDRASCRRIARPEANRAARDLGKPSRRAKDDRIALAFGQKLLVALHVGLHRAAGAWADSPAPKSEARAVRHAGTGDRRGPIAFDEPTFLTMPRATQIATSAARELARSGDLARV